MEAEERGGRKRETSDVQITKSWTLQHIYISPVTVKVNPDNTTKVHIFSGLTSETRGPGDVQVKVLGGVYEHVQISIGLKKMKYRQKSKDILHSLTLSSSSTDSTSTLNIILMH